MRILIADDEYWIREGLKNTIEELFPDKRHVVVGEALNGLEMVEKIASLRPDLAFVDIQMPIMDGLTAIGEAKKKYDSVSWVILTGYSEFQYAKRAMKLDVQEYLLKPIEKQEVKTLLEAVERKRREDRSDRSSVIARQFMDVLSGGHVNSDREQQNAKYQYQAAIILYEEPNTGTAIRKPLYEAIWEYCERLNETYPLSHSFIINLNSFFVLIHYYPKDATEEKRFSFQDGRFIQGAGNHIKKKGFAAAILMPARDSLQEAAEDVALYDKNRRFRMLCRHCKAETHSALAQFVRDSNAETETFLKAVEEMLFAYTKKSLIYYLERGASMQDGWQRCQSQFSDEQREALKYYIAERLELERFCTEEEIGRTNLEQMLNYINENAQKILYAIGEKNEDAVDKALRIIMSSYADNISIAYISEKLGISPNYLSALFHKKMGVSFVKYLTQIRMAKAKELLQKKSASIQEVAEKTGYQNANYFAKVFREYYGLTPTEFQLQSGSDSERQ